MKITKEHFNYLKEKIDNYIMANPDIIEVYETGKFIRSDRVKDIQIRFCFDMLSKVPGLIQWVCDNIYTYADDSHIETALKKICPKIERRY